MDFAGNSILMSHMGEGNYRLARDDRPVEMVGSALGIVDLPLRPVLLRFTLKPGTVTIASLTIKADGKLKLIAAEGEILDFPPINGLMTPHFKFQPKKPLSAFLTEISLEGSSHHFALSYGSCVSLLEKLADLTGVEFAKV
jgi:L-arabinose isomerase